MKFNLILIGVLLCIVLFIIYKKWNINKNIKPESIIYYRGENKVNKITPIHKDIFQLFNFELFDKFNKSNGSNGSNWNIMIPPEYNTIDDQLRKLKVNNYDQKIFALYKCDLIVSKNNLWNIFEQKFGRQDAKNIMPESYITKKPSDMSLLYRTIEGTKSKKLIFIMKKEIQRKNGLKITSDINEIKNARKNGYTVIQRYEQNTMLINKRKLNIRLYVLIIKRNGKLYTYLHNLGKCIYTNKNYDPTNITDFETNITSFNMNQNIYSINPLTLNDLRIYLDKKGYDHKIFFNDIYGIFSKLVTALPEALGNLNSLNNNTCFQLFGADVIIKKGHNGIISPVLLELNKGPDMSYKNEIDKEMKITILSDTMNIVNIRNQEHKPQTGYIPVL
jgi:hypothetical protein